MSGELVYTGALRTPVECGRADRAAPGRALPARARSFALIGDAYLWLGLLDARGYTVADARRPAAHREFAGERLARAVCADARCWMTRRWKRSHGRSPRRRSARVAAGMRAGARTASARSDWPSSPGLGDFIAAEAAQRSGLEVVRLSRARSARRRARHRPPRSPGFWPTRSRRHDAVVIKIGGGLLEVPARSRRCAPRWGRWAAGSRGGAARRRAVRRRRARARPATRPLPRRLALDGDSRHGPVRARAGRAHRGCQCWSRSPEPSPARWPRPGSRSWRRRDGCARPTCCRTAGRRPATASRRSWQGRSTRERLVLVKPASVGRTGWTGDLRAWCRREWKCTCWDGSDSLPSVRTPRPSGPAGTTASASPIPSDSSADSSSARTGRLKR